MTARADIWVVRHGSTEWSEAGRHTSRTDLPLTEAGRRAAAALAPVLAGRSFGLVLSSPMHRSRQTAALAGFPDAQVDADLREWEYGDYEGLTIEEIRARSPGWTVFNGVCPGGETAAEVAERARRTLERADGVAGGVLLFAHGHVLRVLTAVALGLGAAAGAHFAIATATINVIGWEHETRALRCWNTAPPAGAS